MPTPARGEAGWGGGHPTSGAGEQPGPRPHRPAFPVTDFSFPSSPLHEHGNA